MNQSDLKKMSDEKLSQIKQNFKMKNSTYATLCLTVTAFCLPILVGYYFSAMNPMIPTIHTVYNRTYLERNNVSLPKSEWTTLLTVSSSAVIIGAFFAALTGKFFLACMTPKRMIQMLHVLNIIGATVIVFGSGLTGSYEAFILGRFISGYPCGALFVVIPAMLTELSASSQESFWQSMFGSSISLGLFLGSLCGHPKILGSTYLWPVTFGLGMFPSIIYLIASIKIPESPYYYVRAGMNEEATKLLRQLRTGNEDGIEQELQTIKKEINESGTNVIGVRQILANRQYRNQFIGVLCLFSNLMLCGINNIVFYSSLVFIDAGLSDEVATFGTLGIFGAQFIAACVGPIVIKRFGGVRICIASNLVMVVSLGLFTLTRSLQHLSPDVLPYISLLCIAVCALVFGGGLNLAVYVVISEITIEPTRLTCMTYGNVVLWFFSWLVGFVPPYLQIALRSYAMVPWIICGLLGLAYMIICLPNTKGKTREQIQRRLSSKISLSSLRSSKPLSE